MAASGRACAPIAWSTARFSAYRGYQSNMPQPRGTYLTIHRKLNPELTSAEDRRAVRLSAEECRQIVRDVLYRQRPRSPYFTGVYGQEGDTQTNRSPRHHSEKQKRRRRRKPKPPPSTIQSLMDSIHEKPFYSSKELVAILKRIQKEYTGDSDKVNTSGEDGADDDDDRQCTPDPEGPKKKHDYFTSREVQKIAAKYIAQCEDAVGDNKADDVGDNRASESDDGRSPSPDALRADPDSGSLLGASWKDKPSPRGDPGSSRGHHGDREITARFSESDLPRRAHKHRIRRRKSARKDKKEDKD